MAVAPLERWVAWVIVAMSEVYTAAESLPSTLVLPNTRAAMLASWGQTQPPAASSPRRPAAFMRAGAHLVLLSATLIACTRPYCHFVVRARRSSLVLEHVRPDGKRNTHVLPMPSLAGEPDIPALAEQFQSGTFGRDPLTGRDGLIPLQPQAVAAATSKPAAPEGSESSSPRRNGPIEYAQCVTDLRCHAATEEPELILRLPLVLRVWPNGHIDAFMPQPEATDEEYWHDF